MKRWELADRKAYMKKYLKAYRQTPEYKEKLKSRRQTQEYKAKRREYSQRPEVKAARAVYRRTSDQLASTKAYNQTSKAKNMKESYKKTPKAKAILKARQQTQEHKDMRNAYLREQWITNINFRLSVALRGRITKALNGSTKPGSVTGDLGCTINELKAHLEALFCPGMTWDNWALHGWHIDHIKPLASFDLTDREQFLEACNYTNLQPLWAEENLRKGASLSYNTKSI